MFSSKLKELRIGQSLTQAELAKKLNLKPSIIGMYENGRRMPEVKTLKLIANLFNVTTDYLLRDVDCGLFQPKNLIQLRGNRSIQEYSKLLNISEDLLTKFENGTEIPTPGIIEYISEIEGIEPKYFFIASNEINCSKVSKKQNANKLLDNDLMEWLESPDSTEYIKFIYKAYKQGITKDMLPKAEISIKIT